MFSELLYEHFIVHGQANNKACNSDSFKIFIPAIPLTQSRKCNFSINK